MPEDKLYYVYILSSKSRAIYVGMTGFLMSRVLRHRTGQGGAFTRKYRIHRLVYYEVFHSVAAAIARETEIKKWRREKKVALIAQKKCDLGRSRGEVGNARRDDGPGQRTFLTAPARRFGMTSSVVKTFSASRWKSSSGPPNSENTAGTAYPAALDGNPRRE